MWRACQNILPTKDNLVKRKIIQDPLYPICGLEPETSFHIMGFGIVVRDNMGHVLASSKKCDEEGFFGTYCGRDDGCVPCSEIQF